MESGAAPIWGNCQEWQRALRFPRLEIIEIRFDVFERRREGLGLISEDHFVVFVPDGMAARVTMHLHLLVSQDCQPMPGRSPLHAAHARRIKFLPAHWYPLRE